MKKLPCIYLYPGDWLRDDVSGCSLAAQGLWLRMMFLMHDSDRYGYLSKNGVAIPPEHTARRCGIPLEQYTTLLAELDSVGVPSRLDDGTIYSRRMVKDAKLREERSKAGRKGGKATQKFAKAKLQANTKANGQATPEDENEVENTSTRKRRGKGTAKEPGFNAMGIFSARWKNKFGKGYMPLDFDSGQAKQLQKIFLRGRDEDRFAKICDRYLASEIPAIVASQHSLFQFIKNFNRFNIPISAYERQQRENSNEPLLENLPPSLADIDANPEYIEPVENLPFEESEHV